MRRARALAAIVAASVAGCAWLPPKPPAAALPSEAPLSGLAEDGGAWPASDWWKRYADSDLDRLVDMALASSPTLATAHARFDSARQAVRVAGAESGAHVEAEGDGSRQRLSDNGLFGRNCSVSIGTTNTTSAFRRAIPSIGGASRRTPCNQPSTTRTRRAPTGPRRD